MVDYSIKWDDLQKYLVKTDNDKFDPKLPVLENYKKLYAQSYKNYCYPESNKQIQSILKNIPFKKGLYSKFFELFEKFIKHKNLPSFLHQLFKKYGQTDMEIFKNIYPFMNPSNGENESGVAISNSNNEIDPYVLSLADMYLLNIKKADLSMDMNISKIKNYLDFGCGNGSMTIAIGKQLNLDNTNIYGTDIKQQFEQGWEKTRGKKNMNFEYSDTDIIPKKFQNTKFDLITCFMVLHHVENLKPTIAAIAKALNPGGILLIKEHDCYDAADRMIDDLLHSLFIVQNAKDIKEFDARGEGSIYQRILAQKIYYRSKYEWDYIMNDHGLVIKNMNYFGMSVKENINYSRNYVSVYQKL